MHTMKHMFTNLLLLLIISSVCNAELNSSYHLSIGNDSWAFRSRYNIKVNNNFNIYQNYIFKEAYFVSARPILHRYQINSMTFVNEEGYFKYSSNNIKIILGRKYTNLSHGKLSGLLVSPLSPSLDQLNLQYNEKLNHGNLNIDKRIIRLDNRNSIFNDVELSVNRWLFINKIGLESKNQKFKIDFYDAVLSTGINRTIDWYYLWPLPNLILERKHQESWTEGSDSNLVIGEGDNDNHMLGISVFQKFNRYSMFAEFLFDEWQLSKDTRNNMQTVFGLLFGIIYNKDSFELSAEIGLASPWLYLNRGLFSNLEINEIPLGLSYPNSMEVNFSFKYNFQNQWDALFEIKNINKADQNLNTNWDAWNNYIEPFKNLNSSRTQCHLTLRKKTKNIIKLIHYYNNWLNNKGNKIIYEIRYVL